MVDANRGPAGLRSLKELRDSCIDCVCKHLAQALVLMQEVPQGYPKHHWIAVGHLGEAADEAIKEFPKLAAEIRKHRIKYMADPKYSVPVLDLIEKARGHVKQEDTAAAQRHLMHEVSPLKRAVVSYKLAKRGGASTGQALGHGILGLAGGGAQGDPHAHDTLKHTTPMLRQRRREMGWNPKSPTPPKPAPKPRFDPNVHKTTWHRTPPSTTHPEGKLVHPADPAHPDHHRYDWGLRTQHEAKMTKKGREFVSDEISHLMKEGPSKGPQKGKKMPQKQAVAVALDVARRKGFKSPPNPNESVSIFDGLISEWTPPGKQPEPHWASGVGGGESDPTKSLQKRNEFTRKALGVGPREKPAEKKPHQWGMGALGSHNQPSQASTPSSPTGSTTRPAPATKPAPKVMGPIAQRLAREKADPSGHAYRRQLQKRGLGSFEELPEESMDRTPLRFIQKVSAFDALVMEKELTTKGRKQIKPENFAIPEKAPGSGSYPIHDLVHARNALARVSQHGTASEKARVRKAVYSKYPALKERKEENVSIFDDVISERELPEAFKKNMGRGFGKKKAEPEDDSKATDADDAAECGESVSLFDGIVQESGRSIFDDVVQESANWEDRVARTIVLSEELGKIRSSIKNR